jgi:hypothetical protein
MWFRENFVTVYNDLFNLAMAKISENSLKFSGQTFTENIEWRLK